MAPELAAPATGVTVCFKRLSPHAILPRYQSEHASGMDLHAAIDGPLTIEPGCRAVVPCGFAMSIPHGYEAQVRPRSGLARDHGISIPNAPGTIDSDYRGAVAVILINLSREPCTIKPKERIAQMVVAPVSRCRVIEVGEGGFGSTGA